MVTYNHYPAMDANNNFPPVVRLSLSNSPEIIQKVKEVSGPLVLEVIAADSTVAGSAAVAAKAAVTQEVATKNLVSGSDPRLDVNIADDPNFAHVESDNAGNIIFGIKNDGSVYIRNLVGQDFLSSSDNRLPQEMAVDIPSWDSVEVDANDEIIYGTKTDGTIFIRNLKTPSSDTPTDIEPLILPNKIAGFGDSMLADHGGLGVSTLSALESISGVEVYKGGVPGQTSTEAALRQGGLDVFLNVVGNIIPASGYVDVTVQSPSGNWKTGSSWTFTGSLAGVSGTLNKYANDTWRFTRTSSGEALTVKNELRWVSNVTKPSWINIFRIGRNNTNAPIIKRDVLAMSKGLRGDNNRYLIIPLYNATNEPSGTTQYANVMAINADHEIIHGPHYYDLRGWLIRNGLKEANITPTASDLAAIAQDCIPSSLMHDNVHLNAVGRRIEAERIFEILKTKGWL